MKTFKVGDKVKLKYVGKYLNVLPGMIGTVTGLHIFPKGVDGYHISIVNTRGNTEILYFYPEELASPKRKLKVGDKIRYTGVDGNDTINELGWYQIVAINRHYLIAKFYEDTDLVVLPFTKNIKLGWKNTA